MNRTIKFRAWDTKHNKMWSAEEMGLDELTINPEGRGFVNVNSFNTNLSVYAPHLIPLQFTGLLDKNGKEIYEGDILLWTRKKWRCSGHPQNGKTLKEKVCVFWDDDRKQMRIDIYDERRCYCSGSLSNESMKDNRAEKCFVEVIGNKWENGDLLNENIINMDVKCKRCGDKGACQNGYCLACVTKMITEGKFDHILRKHRKGKDAAFTFQSRLSRMPRPTFLKR